MDAPGCFIVLGIARRTYDVDIPRQGKIEDWVVP